MSFVQRLTSHQGTQGGSHVTDDTGIVQVGDLIVVVVGMPRAWDQTHESSGFTSGWEFIEAVPASPEYFDSAKNYWGLTPDIGWYGIFQRRATTGGIPGQRWNFGTTVVKVRHAGVYRGETSVSKVSQVVTQSTSTVTTLPSGTADGSTIVTLVDHTRPLGKAETGVYNRYQATLINSQNAPNVRDAITSSSQTPTLWTWAWRNVTHSGGQLTWSVTPEPSTMRLTVISTAALTAPIAPIILAPVSGTYLPLSADMTVSWRYRPGGQGSQTGYALKRTCNGVDTWWDDATSTWVGTVAHNPRASSTVVIPASAVPSTDEMWQLSVATIGASGNLGAYSPPSAISFIRPPQVTAEVLGRSAEDGTVDDLTPTVSWSTSTSAGVGLDRWEVQVLDSTGTVVASGVGDGGGGRWTAPSLPNLQLYVAQVRVRQTGDMWSAWTAVPFTLDAVQPTAPVVTAAPYAHPTSGAPGFQIVATFDPNDGFDWYRRDVTARFELQLADESWALVGVVDMPKATTVVSLVDYTAPTGVTLRYRVRAESVSVDGDLTLSGWGSSGDLVMTAGPESGRWIMDPFHPETAIRTWERSRGALVIDSGGVATAVLGGRIPVTHYGGRRDRGGSGELLLRSQAEVDKAVALLTSGARLLRRGCRMRDLDGGYRQDVDVWMHITGELSFKMLAETNTQAMVLSYEWAPAVSPHEDV